jgi:hypothetical protein
MKGAEIFHSTGTDFDLTYAMRIVVVPQNLIPHHRSCGDRCPTPRVRKKDTSIKPATKWRTPRTTRLLAIWNSPKFTELGRVQGLCVLVSSRLRRLVLKPFDCFTHPTKSRFLAIQFCSENPKDCESPAINRTLIHALYELCVPKSNRREVLL